MACIRASSVSGRLVACLLLACTLLVLPWSAGAATGARTSVNPSPEERLHAAVVRYQSANRTGRDMLEAYVALSEIWTAWREVDPTRVEHALRLAAADQRKSPAIRQYAEKLVAYARLRRGDVQSAQGYFEQAGYLTDWLIVGPFDNEGKAGFDEAFGPEAEQEDPIVPGRAFSGKERPVRYRPLPGVFRYGWVDFGHVFRPANYICGYATTFVRGTSNADAERARNISLWVGSDGAHRVWFNGRSVVEDDSYRGFDTDRRAALVKLRPGYNRITVKACGAESSPMFALRLGDEGGAPDPTLKTTIDTIAGQAATENVRLASEESPPTQSSAVRGPLSAVEEIENDPRAPRADWELAAEYLVKTGGDDETVHQARNLATKAESSRSVEHQLLLMSLAEDRNAARTALIRAQELADPNDVRVLLARAHHLRTGPSPIQAIEVYDAILALDPDNVAALQGRVELYNRAGLQRSALETLERAYERRPYSVLLANMVASQRKALGLSTLALEAEDQYAALRFDDAAHLTSRIELALARRNDEAVRHWLGRLSQSDPQNLWTYRVASRVHRALGQQERAIVDLEQAHDIAPDDVGVLKSLADLKGRAGNRKEQLALLQKVLRLRPQEVDVRKYVDHIEPPERPADEQYAQSAEEFLKNRHKSADGHPRRTLQDLTVSTVYENGLASQFRQVVFQPLTDAAAATSRQYAFQYQADSQRVELKGARVYRADGSVDEAIESGEAAANDPSISMYTSARTYYVQFPRLEPGDVVELRYRVDDVTPRNEFADYYGDVVYLQSDEPIFHTQYVLSTPKSRTIQVDKKLPGLEETVKEVGNRRIHEFKATNVPPILPEQGMPPWPEVLGFVHVSTYSSWDALGKWYWGLVKEQLDLDVETKKKLATIVEGKTTTEEKVKAVYAWVTKNTRYVALEFGIYGYKPRRCVQTVNRGWGDCKDKATVIVTFLRELGIDANLVVLRTQMRGDFPSELPSLAPFDHAIAYVPELDLYLDGTAEHTGIFELPVMDHGALGLLILDGQAKLVTLPSPDPSKNVIERNVDVRLDAKGRAQIRLDYEIRGYAAPGFRARYGADSNRKDRLAQDLGSEFPGIEMVDSSIETSDTSDTESPMTLSLRGVVPQFGRQEGNQLSLPVTLGTRLTGQYAALSTRTRDVKINGFSTRDEVVTVQLPARASVDALPSDALVESRFGRLKIEVRRDGSTVTVKSHLSLAVDRVSPQDYADFRAFCVRVDDALAHRLVVTP